MRNIPNIIKKEFRQIRRNKSMLPIIFIMPLIQLLILANAATFDIKNLKIYFVDHDLSPTSKLLTDKFEASNYFIISGFGFDPKEAESSLENSKADLFVEIPSGFESQLFRNEGSKILLVSNAIDGSKAGLASYYSISIIRDFNLELLEKYKSMLTIPGVGFDLKQVNSSYSFWFNPDLNYKTFMVPGILVLLITLIATFMTSMNIVREKEIGTIEQINVTPIKKHEFIIGKLLPFWILAMLEMAFGLILAKLIYDIPILGSVYLLFAFAAVFLPVVLGIGMLISTISDTQQQAMFLSWFLLVIFILLSGLFTAVENMPREIQYITYLDPLRYFIEVIRMVMLKGATFMDIKIHFLVMIIFGFLINTLAVIRYKKVG